MPRTAYRALAAVILSLLVVASAQAADLVIGLSTPITSLDPHFHNLTPNNSLARHVFETLVKQDESQHMQPGLAESWKSINDLEWELKLRKGVKFHNGEDFNADSVKFSIERLVNPANKLRGSSSFAPIDRVEIVDPYTVRIHTKKPWPVFLSHIALRQAAMYPPKEYAGKDPAAISRNPIGTGPYKFVSWSKDEEIVMEAFPGYWGGAAKIKTIVFKPIPDDAVRVAALQNGEIDPSFVITHTMPLDRIITQGAMLDCVLETKIVSTVAGMTSCHLTRDVYSTSGRVVLLDRGSRVVGRYQGGMQQGDTRIFVLWTRVETPAGVVVELQSPGAGPLGEAGLGGHVDTRFWDRFGAAVLLSVVEGGVDAAVARAARASQGTSIIVGNTANTGKEVIARSMEPTINIPPVLVKNQGERVGIFVARDLDFRSVYGLERSADAGREQAGP